MKEIILIYFLLQPFLLIIYLKYKKQFKINLQNKKEVYTNIALVLIPSLYIIIQCIIYIMYPVDDIFNRNSYVEDRIIIIIFFLSYINILFILNYIILKRKKINYIFYICFILLYLFLNNLTIGSDVPMTFDLEQIIKYIYLLLSIIVSINSISYLLESYLLEKEDKK